MGAPAGDGVGSVVAAVPADEVGVVRDWVVGVEEPEDEQPARDRPTATTTAPPGIHLLIEYTCRSIGRFGGCCRRSGKLRDARGDRQGELPPVVSIMATTPPPSAGRQGYRGPVRRLEYRADGPRVTGR